MKIDKYFLRRIKKWWQTRVVKHFWRDLPFEIAYTEIIKGKNEYTFYPEGQKLAEFDCKGRHYYIYKEL